MLSVLDKFDAVTVDNVSLISDSDRVKCEALQSNLDAFVKFAQKYILFVEENGVVYGEKTYYSDSPKRLVDDMKKCIKDTTHSFISDIVYHFEQTYNVTIDSSDIRDKYDHTVRYTSIVDEIIAQLDGMNFTEKAVREIKSSLQKHTRNHNGVNFAIVKGNKVSLSSFLWFEESWSKGKYRLRWAENARSLFAGLSHFESGSTQVKGCFNGLYSEYPDRDDWFDGFDFDYLNKVKHVKFYKNGKVDVKFTSSELAAQFNREYLEA